MRAGQLDRRVVLTREAVTNTPMGLVRAWSTYATLWASRKDVSDGEKAASGTIEGTVVSRFVLRSNSLSRTIRPKDRLTEGELTFDITGIKEIGRRDQLEITAQARLD